MCLRLNCNQKKNSIYCKTNSQVDISHLIQPTQTKPTLSFVLLFQCATVLAGMERRQHALEQVRVRRHRGHPHAPAQALEARRPHVQQVTVA